MSHLAARTGHAATTLVLAGSMLLALVACSPAAEVSTAPTSAHGPGPDASADPAAAPTPTRTRDAATEARITAPADTRVAARCDNIIDPASTTTVVDLFVEEGSTPLPPEPLLARGARCATDGGRGDFYAWSPASQAEWDAQVALLTGPDSGWFTETGPRGTYVTYKIDGRYEQTFLFTGDAVIVAPRKAATDIVIGPPIA